MANPREMLPEGEEGPCRDCLEENVLLTIMNEAADGILVQSTISRVMDVMGSIVKAQEDHHDHQTTSDPSFSSPSKNEPVPPSGHHRPTLDMIQATAAAQDLAQLPKMEPEALNPSRFTFLDDKEVSRILSYLPAEGKKGSRVICRRWKSILDRDHIYCHRTLSRDWVEELLQGHLTPIEKLTVCNLLDVDRDTLDSLSFLQGVKYLEIESPRPGDYSNRPTPGFQQPTIGESNLIKIFCLCPNVRTLVLHNGAVGNFGLELLEVNRDDNHNEVVVGWEWPPVKLNESMSVVTNFLQSILGNLDRALGNDDPFQHLDEESGPNKAEKGKKSIKHGAVTSQTQTNITPGQIHLSDLAVTYKTNPPPPFPAFIHLTAVHLDHVETLELTVHPTKNAEKMGLVAFLHVLSFPQLRSLTLHCQEYIPDEALYRTIFKFLVKHSQKLKELSLTNPILSTHLVTEKLAYLPGLDKISLKELTVAWELPIGLDLYWPNGHFLLENQKRLRKLEFHTTSVRRAMMVAANNFRFLTIAHIDVTDTSEEEFDCGCFHHCGKLRMLTVHVGISVRMVNVNQLPDTLEILHWDAMYTRDDIRWFSRFLILARHIYLYHDKNVPMDIFVPFHFGVFLHFVRLPCLEQLYLPRIHIQDSRVTRFCEAHEGIRQERDLFFIDRAQFIFSDAYAHFNNNSNFIKN